MVLYKTIAPRSSLLLQIGDHTIVNGLLPGPGAARIALVRKVILQVSHNPGRHCASTALSDIACFHHAALSEAMCFGIGAGLGIWYLENLKEAPGRMVHVRSVDIEDQFFTRMGSPFRWRRFKDPDLAAGALRQRLDEGFPILVQTDIYHLGYYGSKTHFPGHDITVWGYDDESGVFFVTDTERPSLIPVPYRELITAMYARGGFFPLRGNQFSPSSISCPEDLGAVIRDAIVTNSRLLLSEQSEFQGIAALRRWSVELERVWPRLEDWRWAARFAYQVIERRGTGGGGFRLMYADFLEEAQDRCPAVAKLGLPGVMRNAGYAWTRLALALKEASEKTSPDFQAVIEALDDVARIEEEYHRTAVALAA